MDTSTYSDKSFWPEFEKDLSSARRSVQIHSPFLSSSRLKKMTPLLKRLGARQVLVCVFLQELQPRSQPDVVEERRYLVEQLNSLHVHVNSIPNMHAKAAIIDQDILWEGSLNILSHSYTSERMRRIVDKREIVSATNDFIGCDICRRRKEQFLASSGSKLVQKLIEFRTERNLSQREFGRRCGLTQARVSQIEHGAGNVTLSTFCALIDQLDCSLVLIPKRWSTSVLRFLEEIEGLPTPADLKSTKINKP